jgi:two-component system, sensor histidine kinase
MTTSADGPGDQEPTPAGTPCPYCGGALRPGAHKCKHCHEYIDDPAEVLYTLSLLMKAAVEKTEPTKAPVQRTLLIVEDHEGTRRAMTRLLRRWGWDVLEAGSLADCLRLANRRLDCALIDLILPDGDGESIVRALRSVDAETRIVVCTGVVDRERLRRARALGASAVLEKPFDSRELEAACKG